MDFSVLSRYDDILASYFVDSLYLWYDTLRMNGDFIGTSVDKKDTVNKIRQYIVAETFTNKAVKDAAESFLTLPYFKDFIDGLAPKQVTEFTQHMKRYLSMYRPNAGFEVGSTTRYTGKPEACLLATKDWKAGEQVSCCVGSIAALSEQDDLKLKREGRDFSVMVSTRKKCSCLFLGPARFMNHDCDSNCEFILVSQNAITFRVRKDIKIGEEMTVFYAEHYFGENNCECLCCSCERNKQGHFSASDENTVTDTSDSDESSTRRSCRKRKAISYKEYYLPDQTKKSRQETIPFIKITNTENPMVMKKKQLFCEQDPFRPRNDSLDQLSKFHEWIDDLSDISDDEREVETPKCCPQSREYCMSRISERPDLCGRCNRHFQIYGYLWPMRKIKKPSGRSKKVKIPNKSCLPAAQLPKSVNSSQPKRPLQENQTSQPLQTPQPIQLSIPNQLIQPIQQISILSPMQDMSQMHAISPISFTPQSSPQLLTPYTSQITSMPSLSHITSISSMPPMSSLPPLTSITPMLPVSSMQPPYSLQQTPLTSLTSFRNSTFPTQYTQFTDPMQLNQSEPIRPPTKQKVVKPRVTKPKNSKPKAPSKLKTKRVKPKNLESQRQNQQQPSTSQSALQSSTYSSLHTHTDNTTDNPLVISVWPLDKSIPKIHNNNLTEDQKKQERTLALNLKKRIRARKTPYKLVGLDAKLNETRDRLGALELQNAHLSDLRNLLKNMVSTQRPTVSTNTLPILKLGDVGTRAVLEYNAPEPEFMFNPIKLETSNISVPTCSLEESTDYPIEPLDTNSNVSCIDSVENLVLAENEVPVKNESPEPPAAVLKEKSNNYIFSSMLEFSRGHQEKLALDKLNDERTYHPLDTSNNTRVTYNSPHTNSRICQPCPNSLNRIGFYTPESSLSEEIEFIKQEPEEITLSSFLETPISNTPTPIPQQTPMKVSFLLQPSNETPKAPEPSIFKTDSVKPKTPPRKKAPRKGCPIAPPRKEPLVPPVLPHKLRAKYRDAPPPRSIPITPTKGAIRLCSSNPSVGPFVPSIEPNNC